MPSGERLYDRGTYIGEKRLRDVGEEFKHQRIQLGLSQKRVSEASRVARADYSRVERGKLSRLSVVTAARIAAVLGLELWLKVFPDSDGIRDAGQAKGLGKLLAWVRAPLGHRTEVTLPTRPDRVELRAWDAQITGGGEKTSVEYEARLYDVQAQQRRWHGKLRDDPPDYFLLVIANTPANRRVLREHVALFADLPRLRTANVMKSLQAGRHPGTGVALI